MRGDTGYADTWISNFAIQLHFIMKKFLKPLLYVNFKVNVQERPSSRDSGPFNTKFNLASLWLTLYNPAAACWPVASAMAWRWVLSPAFSCQRSFPRHTRPPRTKMGINMSFIISWDLNFTKDSHNLQGHSCCNLGRGQRCTLYNPALDWRTQFGQWSKVYIVHCTTLLWAEEHNLILAKHMYVQIWIKHLVHDEKKNLI